MSVPSDLTGLILAGGKSRRFGGDKARYVVGDKTMIEHVIAVVAEVTVALLIGLQKETDEALIENPALHYIADQYKDAGPLAGVHAGLTAATTPWLLVVACDMPFLTPDVLRLLASARAPDADAVVARTPDGRCHPLCACYHQRVLLRVEEHLDAGTLAMHALLDRMEKVTYVDLPADPLRNVNHLSDLDITERSLPE